MEPLLTLQQAHKSQVKDLTISINKQKASQTYLIFGSSCSQNLVNQNLLTENTFYVLYSIFHYFWSLFFFF